MLSIIIPVYNEEANIGPLFKKLQESLENLGGPWEAVFVDDGSTDGSPAKLEAMAKACPGPCVFLRLSRNFGQSAALAAGIDHARGEILATMDADGQNDPQDIPRMLALLQENRCDVVCGWRKDRQDGFLRGFFSRAANRLVSSITGIDLHDYGCTLRLYRRRWLDQVQLMGDMHRLLPAYLAWHGAVIMETAVRHLPRTRGESKYGILSRTLRVLPDAFLLKFYFSYFTRPIHFFGNAALACLAGAVFIEFFVLMRKIFLHGEWLSPLFFLGLFFAAIALFFLFMGALADLIVRGYASAHGFKPYHVAEGPGSLLERTSAGPPPAGRGQGPGLRTGRSVEANSPAPESPSSL